MATPSLYLTTLRDMLGGTCEHTGGNVYCLVIPLPGDRVAVLDDDPESSGLGIYTLRAWDALEEPDIAEYPLDRAVSEWRGYDNDAESDRALARLVAEHVAPLIRMFRTED